MHSQYPARLRAVESHVTMERVDELVDGGQLRVTMSYDPSDPFAVTATLHSDSGPVRWTFGRELLTDGVHEPAGDGDVVVWPALDHEGRSVVVIELHSPDGSFAGQVFTRELAPFIRNMLGVVPIGCESELLDVDAGVERLLRPDTGHEGNQAA